jgi:hypothetical protein
MSEPTGKELELALAERMGRERTPAEKMLNEVEDHIIKTDAILQALIDVAERGREEMEAGVYDLGARFNVISDLLEEYRERHQAFIKALYTKKAA